MSTTYKVLLVESVLHRARAIQDQLEEGHGHLDHQVKVVHVFTEAQARAAVQKQKFHFLLVDFFPADRKLRNKSVLLDSANVRDNANGPKIAHRLLALHRHYHHTSPRSPRQFRTIIYVWAKRIRFQSDCLRIEVLGEGVHGVVPVHLRHADVLIQLLSDMIELQKAIASQRGYIGKVSKNLGCGISIIGRDHKIWYCSEKNARLAGINGKTFLDRVCWREYHGFEGRSSPCPECPAIMVMNSDLCGKPSRRRSQCFAEAYPSTLIERTCSHRSNIGGRCPFRGKVLRSYTNTRLLPAGPPLKRTLKWVHVVAIPILNSSRTRVIGAVETVLELKSLYGEPWEGHFLRGGMEVEQLLDPALNVIQWLGYARARVYRWSDDEAEIIGVHQVGGLIKGEFEGMRYPRAKTVLDKASKYFGKDTVGRGPAQMPDILGTRHRTHYIVLSLRDIHGKLNGMLVVDDIKDRNSGSTKRFDNNDIRRLRGPADYIGSVLGVWRRWEGYAVLGQQAKVLTDLETKVGKYMESHAVTLATEHEHRLKQFLLRRLHAVFRGDKEVVGFHVRFLETDGKLHMYPGFGPYGESMRKSLVSPEDPKSYSARALRERREVSGIIAKQQAPFRRFHYLMSRRHSRKVLQWCRRVKVLGCIPIHLSGINIGALAIQSSATDYFSSRTTQFLQLVSNVIARTLAPCYQTRYFSGIWERLGYTYRGPASSLVSILDSLLSERGSFPERPLIEGAFGLARLILSKSNTFLFETAGGREIVKPVLREFNFWKLWLFWSAIFRGIANHSDKRIAVYITPTPDQEGTSGLPMQSDPLLLSEIIFNLYENAWKACSDKVWVRAEVSPRCIVVHVQDNGKGVSKAASNRIWAGQHVDYEQKTTRGFGFGLKWSKRFANKLGVDISFDANGKHPYTGAHFKATIPLI